ncbi:uncharacterized protein [Ambystoma mexicanum]|uniref:uncharacterized protein n=1 Tax=Ambystoma mexicanum TaxID=8296 RepID=UPI0037E972CD
MEQAFQKKNPNKLHTENRPTHNTLELQIQGNETQKQSEDIEQTLSESTSKPSPHSDCEQTKEPIQTNQGNQTAQDPQIPTTWDQTGNQLTTEINDQANQLTCKSHTEDNEIVRANKQPDMQSEIKETNKQSELTADRTLAKTQPNPSTAAANNPTRDTRSTETPNLRPAEISAATQNQTDNEEPSKQSSQTNTPRVPMTATTKKEKAKQAKLQRLQAHTAQKLLNEPLKHPLNTATGKAARLSSDITEIDSIMNSAERRKEIFGEPTHLATPSCTSTPLTKHFNQQSCESHGKQSPRREAQHLHLKIKKEQKTTQFDYDAEESFHTPAQGSTTIHPTPTSGVTGKHLSPNDDNQNQRLPTSMFELQNMLLAVVSQSMIPFLKLHEAIKDNIRDQATLLAMIHTKQIHTEDFINTIGKRLDSEAEQSCIWQQRLFEIARGDKEEKIQLTKELMTPLRNQQQQVSLPQNTSKENTLPCMIPEKLNLVQPSSTPNKPSTSSSAQTTNPSNVYKEKTKLTNGTQTMIGNTFRIFGPTKKDP